ncbi:FG-GAP repeat domain-containing protein [Aestuariivivens sediminis]|uniref:FG-GAP repeat domain-containing protein n=1 Tax=Aestuariivivens sediminis TaxID=2913557 RepID=UPI001F59025A|nr:VCBS repeat-containing protein [Aestuariivivens sediminis]
MIETKPKKIILITSILIIVVVALFVVSYLSKREKRRYTENLYELRCGSCHLVPAINNIPKPLWETRVLPEMAKRMGLKNYMDGRGSYSSEEQYYIEKNNAYPKKQMIDSLEWLKLCNYILSMAPESLSNLPDRTHRNRALKQFDTSFISINTKKPQGGIVNLKFDSRNNSLLIGDVFGQLFNWNGRANPILNLESPIISSISTGNSLIATEIGIMSPSEIPKGELHLVHSDTIISLQKELHRPVYTECNDLNNDGNSEIIICEFGHITGELSLLEKEEGVYMKRTLLALPGSIKVEVVDMNNDGKKDIIALFAQGREGIYIFYQKENFEFEIDPVILMGPEYGSSWFSLLDYNNDGHLDILLANGDNADYSRFLKPYHGVRLFINNKKNAFKEEWFYPINGATRVLNDDFDQDGDMDFAVLSFFPDFDNGLEEGFVYLENNNATQYSFTAHTTIAASNGNWLVMEKGDFDNDGDIDLMLGNFSMLASNKFKSKKENDLLFLQNNLFNDRK